MPNVDVTRVANALNLDERRVQQLVKEGMPRESRGQYDAVKCMLWYVRYLQNAIEKRAAPAFDGAFVGERRERIRLLRVAADLKEDRLAEARSQLVAVSDVDAMTKDLVRTTTAEIMAIAPRLAPQRVGETSRVMIQAKIERACKESLSYHSKSAPIQDAVGSLKRSDPWLGGDGSALGANIPWNEALDHPGAFQMGFVRRLFESLPFTKLVPDQRIILNGPTAGGAKIRAARSSDGSFAIVYSPSGEPFTLDKSIIKGNRVNEIWYDPRYGVSYLIHQSDQWGIQTYTPPTNGRGNDWIFLLEDASASYPLPGQPH